MGPKKTDDDSIQQIRAIELGDIYVGEDNVRLTDAKKELDELAASIERNGLLHPVVLKGHYGDPPYELISGQRRFLAHQQILKSPTIRAVFAGDLSRDQSLVRSLVENLQRLDLEYVDTARAVTYLYKKHGRSIDAVHRETGLSLRKIRDFILIQERATPRMKSLLKQRKVSLSDVKRAIRASQDNLKKAEELLDLIMEFQPTAHQKQRLVKYGESKRGASAESIFKEAIKPHVEQNIMISLPDDLRAAVVKATEALSMEPEELATTALSDWLSRQGFI